MFLRVLVCLNLVIDEHIGGTLRSLAPALAKQISNSPEYYMDPLFASMKNF
jgi:hypothetical protein